MTEPTDIGKRLAVTSRRQFLHEGGALLGGAVIAGAAIGVVSPKFADWHKAFWDNLAVTIELHHIKKVIAIDHRDCGADRQQGVVTCGRSVVGDDDRLRGLREWDRLSSLFEKLYRSQQSGRLQPRGGGIRTVFHRLGAHNDA